MATFPISYEVRYRPLGTTNWLTATSSVPSITLTGLNGSLTYEAQVRSVCPDNSTSSYSTSSEFPVVVSVSDNNISTDSVVIVNTNENSIKVKMLKGSIISRFEVYDVSGKQLINQTPNASEFEVNNVMFNNRNVYFSKITFDNGFVKYKKFIKY